MSTTKQRVYSLIPPRASAAYQGAVTRQITTEPPGEVKALAITANVLWVWCAHCGELCCGLDVVGRADL